MSGSWRRREDPEPHFPSRYPMLRLDHVFLWPGDMTVGDAHVISTPLFPRIASGPSSAVGGEIELTWKQPEYHTEPLSRSRRGVAPHDPISRSTLQKRMKVPLVRRRRNLAAPRRRQKRKLLRVALRIEPDLRVFKGSLG